uniref:Uncharacterized protein n=1 Tax=Nelumbo nucifera TaxID=4432 RepID=A0A822Z760_NELNU|nr:TPA_asm: hypothetical protein HUJ06_013562 [Nelumbo nucifera]
MVFFFRRFDFLLGFFPLIKYRCHFFTIGGYLLHLGRRRCSGGDCFCRQSDFLGSSKQNKITNFVTTNQVLASISSPTVALFCLS